MGRGLVHPGTSVESERDTTVGIIGGMGPEATIDLMRRVIAATPAADDEDHIRMLVDSNPQVPSRIRALIDKTGPSPSPALEAMAKGLQRQGADFLAMPCNTAHHYYPAIAAAVDVPVLNLMQLVSEYVVREQPGVERVGLLASTALSEIALYEPWFEESGVQILYPDTYSQSALMNLICAVKAGGAKSMGYTALRAAAEQLQASGADCLLIACTELSVIADELQAAAPVYDASEILARAVVARAKGAPAE
ncbi:MAG: aspartate racemase [Halieaceae bacterium]|jgi:aspartate racemase